jgi:predicted permease
VRTTIALIVGILVALAGTIFTLQGLGVIVSASPMTNDRTWVVIGAGLVVLGLSLSWWAWRRRSGSGPPPA